MNSSVSESTCRRVVNDPPYRLPGQRIAAAGSVYILKRKRWLKLPVVRIGGEVHPPAAVQRLGPFLGGEWHALGEHLCPATNEFAIVRNIRNRTLKCGAGHAHGRR